MAELKPGVLAFYDSFNGLVSVRVLDVSQVKVGDGWKAGQVQVRTCNDWIPGFPKGEVHTVPVSALVQRKVRIRDGHLKVRSF